MEVLIDVRMIEASGIGTYIQNLIPYLKGKVNLTLLGNEDIIKKYVEDVEVIPLKSPVYSPLEQIEIPFKLKKCDIYWSPHFNMAVFSKKPKKRIVTIHDLFHLDFASYYNFFERKYINMLIRSAANISNVIITVSNFSKERIIEHTKVNSQKIEVIYNGVDSNIFKVYGNTILDKIKKDYNLPEKFILYVGNVKPHKNLKNAIRAFELLLRKHNEFYLVIVGKKEGFYKEDKNILHILAGNKILSKKIIFMNYIDKKILPFIYNLARLFLFPSFYEGFGLPILEAMACGCPVVASNIPVIREIYGDAVYYVNPFDPLDMVRGILELEENEELRQTLINKGFEKAKEFSWEKSGKKHLEIILGL